MHYNTVNSEIIACIYYCNLVISDIHNDIRQCDFYFYDIEKNPISFINKISKCEFKLLHLQLCRIFSQ